MSLDLYNRFFRPLLSRILLKIGEEQAEKCEMCKGKMVDTHSYLYLIPVKFGDEHEESAEYYYKTSLSKGYTTGGPGEILQGVDSESAFGLLESYVTLYDVTGNEKWLEYAKENAHYCSSWVVSYNYKFPAKSEFGRHDKKTVGSVFANIQNKHSASVLGL